MSYAFYKLYLINTLVVNPGDSTLLTWMSATKHDPKPLISTSKSQNLCWIHWCNFNVTMV